MKTKTQKALINAVNIHSQFWQEVDNIDCTSHNIDIIDQIIILQEDKLLDQKDAEKFGDMLMNLLKFIRKTT